MKSKETRHVLRLLERDWEADSRDWWSSRGLRGTAEPSYERRGWWTTSSFVHGIKQAKRKRITLHGGQQRSLIRDHGSPSACQLGQRRQ